MYHEHLTKYLFLHVFFTVVWQWVSYSWHWFTHIAKKTLFKLYLRVSSVCLETWLLSENFPTELSAKCSAYNSLQDVLIREHNSFPLTLPFWVRVRAYGLCH